MEEVGIIQPIPKPSGKMPVRLELKMGDPTESLGRDNVSNVYTKLLSASQDEQISLCGPRQGMISPICSIGTEA
jgi:hypothetical protein